MEKLIFFDKWAVKSWEFCNKIIKKTVPYGNYLALAKLVVFYLNTEENDIKFWIPKYTKTVLFMSQAIYFIKTNFIEFLWLFLINIQTF